MTNAAGENDSERFKNYQFKRPPRMVDDDLTVLVDKLLPYEPVKGWVPCYRFALVHTHSRAVMGDLDLRVALTPKLRLMGGHIGYEVAEPYRGQRYATRACRLVLPFARSLGIDPVYVTCAPDNIPSIKTIEALGGQLIDTYGVEIEPGVMRMTSMYHVYHG